MPIKRCSAQKAITLEAFYRELAKRAGNHSPLPAICERMLLFLKMVDDLFKETTIWTFTSHDRLVLQNEDKIGRNLVIISSIGLDSYYFEYLLPVNKSPWPNAMVRGEAKNLEEAKKYLLIAMRESEGWIDNEELNHLLSIYIQQ